MPYYTQLQLTLYFEEGSVVRLPNEYLMILSRFFQHSDYVWQYVRQAQPEDSLFRSTQRVAFAAY